MPTPSSNLDRFARSFRSPATEMRLRPRNHTGGSTRPTPNGNEQVHAQLPKFLPREFSSSSPPQLTSLQPHNERAKGITLARISYSSDKASRSWLSCREPTGTKRSFYPHRPHPIVPRKAVTTRETHASVLHAFFLS